MQRKECSRATGKTLALIREKGLPYIIVYNKSDLTKRPDQIPEDVLYVSARDNTGIHELKERLARLKPQDAGVPIVRDMVRPGDFFVLVVPVDSAAPKGRLILPQQQTIRDIRRCRRDGRRRQGNGT